MDQKLAERTAEAAVYKPCAYCQTGATMEFCHKTSGTLATAQGKCLSTSCDSPYRYCIACVMQGEEHPNPKARNHDRLCNFHANNGMRAIRPKEAVQAPTRDTPKLPITVQGPRRFSPTLNPALQAPAVAAVPRPKVEAPAPPPKVIEARVIPEEHMEMLPPVPPVQSSASVPAWQEVLDRVRKAMGEAEFVKVHPSHIRPMPGQPREYFDEEGLHDLTQSLKSVGQFQPGIIRAVDAENGIEYELLDGERRWRSAILAGIDVYKAMQVKIDDEAAPFVVASIANFNRAGHTHMELSNAISRLHKELHIPVEMIAEMYNMTSHWAYQLMGLQNLHQQIRDMLDPRLTKKSDLLPITAAIQVSKIDPSVQAELVEDFRSGEITLKGLRKRAVEIAQKSGTYVRQREADQPARRIKSLDAVSRLLVRTATNLKSDLNEAWTPELLRTHRHATAGILPAIMQTEDLLLECKEILAKFSQQN